jgi:hypothetical protein
LNGCIGEAAVPTAVAYVFQQIWVLTMILLITELIAIQCSMHYIAVVVVVQYDGSGVIWQQSSGGMI